MYFCLHFFLYLAKQSHFCPLKKTNLFREFSVNQDVLYLFDLHQTILIGWYVIRIWHHFDGTRAWWPRQTVVDLQIWKYNIRRLVYKTVCILMVQKGPSMENGSLSKHYRGTEVISGNSYQAIKNENKICMAEIQTFPNIVLIKRNTF